jgi:hypothetical protein
MQNRFLNSCSIIGIISLILSQDVLAEQGTRNKTGQNISLRDQALSLRKIKLAFAHIESNDGKNVGPRFEKTFLKKYKNLGHMPELIKKFGSKAAASSYGKYQIMLEKAWELGYRVTPEELSRDETNERVFLVIVHGLMKKYGNTESSLWNIARSYNGTGPAAEKYAQKLSDFYRSLNEKSNSR